MYSVCFDLHGMYIHSLPSTAFYLLIKSSGIFLCFDSYEWIFYKCLLYNQNMSPFGKKITSIQLLGRLISSQRFKAFFTGWALSYSFKDAALKTAIWFVEHMILRQIFVCFSFDLITIHLPQKHLFKSLFFPQALHVRTALSLCTGVW